MRRKRALVNMAGNAIAVAIVIVLVSALAFSKEPTNQVLTSTGPHFIAFLP